MKVFAIIFLTLFAFTAGFSGDSFEDFPKLDLIKYDLIKTNPQLGNYGFIEITEEFIKQETDKANQFINQFNQLSDDIKIEAYLIAKDAKNNIEILFEKINKKIIDLKKMGGVYKVCAEKLENNLKEIKLKGVENAVQCVKDVASALKEFAVEVSKEVAELTKNIVKLVLLVKECVDKNGIIVATKCAFQKISEVKELVPKIVNGIKSTVETVSNKANQVIAVAKSCKESNFRNLKVIFEKNNGEINKCYDVVQKSIKFQHD